MYVNRNRHAFLGIYTFMHMPCQCQPLIIWRLHVRLLKVSRGDAWPVVCSITSYTLPLVLHLNVYISVPNKPTCSIFMSLSAFLIRHILVRGSGCFMHKCVFSEEVSVWEIISSSPSLPCCVYLTLLYFCLLTLHVSPSGLLLHFHSLHLF